MVKLQFVSVTSQFTDDPLLWPLINGGFSSRKVIISISKQIMFQKKLRFFVKVHCKGMPLRLHFKGGHYLSADTIAILQYVLKRWHMGE